MMETTTAGLGLAELFLLLFSGQFLGMPPGERDPAILQAAPAAAYLYWEWAAPADGIEGVPGMDGLIADPEMKTLLATIEASLFKGSPADEDQYGEITQSFRAELPKLLLLAARHPGGAYLAGSDVPIGKSQLVPLEAAVILSLGDDRERFLAGLNRALSHLPGYEAQEHPRNSVIPLSGVTLRLHEDGERVILALGAGALENVQARWHQPQAELTQQPAFAAAWKSTPVPRVGSIAWLNLASVRGDLQQKFGLPGMMIHNVAQSLGLSQVDSVLTVSGVEANDMISRTQVAINGPPDGVLSLLSGRAVTEADLSQIPADADFVAAGSLDLQAVHRSLRDIVAKTAPDVLVAFDEFQHQLELELRLNLQDLFQGFGDVWTVYDAPSNGGLALTGMVAVVPVRDVTRADTVFRRMMDIVRETLPLGSDGEGTTLKELAFAGETIHYLNSSGYTVRYEGHPPFSPAFCLTKQHLLLALHPQALKAHLRFLQSNDARFPAVMKQKLPLSGGEALALLYADTPRIGRAIYPVIPLMMKSKLAELQAQGLPVDIAAIPSARAVLPYLRETSASVLRRPDGLLIEQRNTLPLWLSLLLFPQMENSFGQSHEDGGMILEGRNAATLGAPTVQLGAAEGAEGVVPAKAEAPAKPEVKEPTAVEKAARRTVPALVRGLIPDNIEGFIPPEVFQKMAAPPDPEAAAARAAERQRRKDARAARRAARLAK